MQQKIIRYGVTFLVVLAVLSMATGTFLEKSYSTDFAQKYIYQQFWFELMWLLLANYLIYKVIPLFKSKRFILFSLHLSLIVILLGAGITRYFGENGAMRIREGQATNIYFTSDINTGTQSVNTLPFNIHLNNFEMEMYAGSKMPSSYTSNVTVIDDEKQNTFDFSIYMNHILNYRGYRFYQTSYDEDLKGTILSINHDPVGTFITYFGYVLLSLTLLLMLFVKHAGFRQLLKHPSLAKSLIVLIVCSGFIFSTKNSYASGNMPSHLHINDSVVHTFERLWVEDGKGRFKPVQTIATELTLKLTRKNEIYDMSASAFFLSLMLYPNEWSSTELIKVKNKELQDILGISSGKASIQDFFTENGYKLQDVLLDASKNNMKQNAFEKEVTELTELVSIYRAITNQQFLRIYPNVNEPASHWLSPKSNIRNINGNDSLLIAYGFNLFAEQYKSGKYKEALQILDKFGIYQKNISGAYLPDTRKKEIEIAYNKSNIFSHLFKGYFFVGLLLLIFYFIGVFKSKEYKYVRYSGLGLLLAMFIAETVFIIFRVYISGYAPMSNGYETMLTISWMSILLGLIFSNRSGFILPAASIFTSLVLMVANLNWMNPEITSLVPVLKSYWLSIHVSLMMISYTGAGITFILSIISLILALFVSSANVKDVSKILLKISIINRLFILLIIVFISIGIICGAVWANESWGAYWSWDPKETWALISMFVYAILAHFKKIKPINLSGLLVLAFAFVLMTYFGVNYYLGGKHSYAGSADITFVGFVSSYLVLFLLLFFGARYRYGKMLQ